MSVKRKFHIDISLEYNEETKDIYEALLPEIKKMFGKAMESTKWWLDKKLPALTMNYKVEEGYVKLGSD